METAALKSFATWARTTLIREVRARVATALAQASPERVEQPAAVAALENAVKAAAGGETGRAALADKVAYTWFNRIVALRFMDANGYTGIGVVSPEHGQAAGQPEVLAEAKRGNFDADVVRPSAVTTITSLLNGTRRSTDPQGEAFALLLEEYCRYWNRSMPFMFEREGDYTELLIPANLLADDSIMARAVDVLTADVCNDVEVIGWLYQFYISERKAEVFADFKNGKKAGTAEIPPATQLFTPHWIVRYLVENSLGRLWLLNRPTSRLVDRMKYYIGPVDEEIDYLKVASPEELKIIDPACGSGHMLTYAFDLLYAIYEEEGYAPSDIPGLILANNLYGTEIDPRAGTLAAFALTMKARARQRTFFNKQVEPSICALEPISFTPSELDVLVTNDGDRDVEAAFWGQFQHADIFGSLIRPRASMTDSVILGLAQSDLNESDLIGNDLLERARTAALRAEYLSRHYHVVVANPPYMSSGNMCSLLSGMAKVAYPNSKSNLYAMFIERCLAFSSSGGFVGMITMESWMFLRSYAALREDVLRKNDMISMAHLGAGAFDSIGGEVVATSAFQFQKAAGGDSSGTYIRLVEEADEAAKSSVLRAALKNDEHPQRYHATAQELLEIPGGIMAYWLQSAAVHAFQMGTVNDHARSEGAVKTGNNARYLRRLWEVNHRDVGAARRWRLHPKGGGFRRWYGNVDMVVDWSAAARSHYRSDPIARIPAEAFWNLSGITWSSVSTSRASFRLLEQREIANNAALFIFPNDENRTYPILGYLNSKFAAEYLEAIAPTINYLVGDVMALPLPEKFADEPSLCSNVEALIEAARDEWNELETSESFVRLPLMIWGEPRIAAAVEAARHHSNERHVRIRQLEEANERLLGLTFGHVASPLGNADDDKLGKQDDGKLVRDLISYAVGCMFGRYSLDGSGLILANQGDTLREYVAKVSNPSFMPDKDNVIPIVDGDWFEDDIVVQLRQFLRVAFGERHFQENLRFVAEALGVIDLRDYFLKSFYADHLKRYKKRPIYWLFSSPKGSFNALIYMHRYTPSTISTVLNEYLREYRAKLDASRKHHEGQVVNAGTPRERAAAQKEADRLRKVILELDEYEHDVLYPLATRQIKIDLDDGVKVNYPKFGAALKKISGLEASDD